MAPKKRSQTPRHPGVNDPQQQLPDPVQTHYAPSPQPVSPSTSTTRDRRRKPKDILINSPIVASNRSPTIANSPRSPIDGIAFGSHSRRESTSTMRTSSISLEGHSSCTPTGRISKAKKGKRVHACEFPGCGKVSTSLGRPPNPGLPFGPKGTRWANMIGRSSLELNTEGKHCHGPEGPFCNHLPHDIELITS